MCMATLPRELVEQIIDLLYDDTASLRACALICRNMAVVSQRHLFRVVTIHSVERAAQLHDLAACSPDLAHLIRTVKLVGRWEKPHTNDQSPPARLVNVPNIDALLRSLPRFDNADALELSKFFWESEDAELLSATFPSVTKLHLRNVRGKTFHGLIAIVSAFPTLAVLVADQVASDTGYEGPDTPLDVQSPPRTLHTLDLRLRRYRPNSIPWMLARIFARWLASHPAPEVMRTLTYVGGEYDPGPALGHLLCAWGPRALQHLELEITNHKGSLERQQMLSALSECTKLKTFILTFVVFDTETPNLSGIMELLTHLSSPTMSSITLSLRAEPRWPISLPAHCYEGKPEVLRFAKLCSSGWASVDTILTKPQFAGLDRFIVKARGDEAELRTFLLTRCSVLSRVIVFSEVVGTTLQTI